MSIRAQERGSPELMKLLTEDLETTVGGKFSFEEDPVKAAHLMMAHMDKKRRALKLKPLMYARNFLEESPAEPAVKVTERDRAAMQVTDGSKKPCSGQVP